MSGDKASWRFPGTFWIANVTELCERAAYYGTFIATRTYLIRVVGLDDVQAGFVAGLFGALIYLFPFFSGAIADRLGFRNSLMWAFALLAAGYSALGLAQTLGPVLVGLSLIVLGGSFVKPVITGTASRCSTEANRARAFSIFYMMVNIGSFMGKTVVAPIRIEMGVQNVPWFSAAASVLALLITAFFYRPHEGGAGRPQSLAETLRGMVTVMRHFRFAALILITAGFWAIQGQLYASMPDYVMRMAGEGYRPEWYANVNPLMVVTCVVWVTYLVRRWPPALSIAVAMAIIPLSSLAMAASQWFHGPLRLFGAAVHPITAMMVVGIALQGFAECFLSPKYLEYASRQAPAGREGLYLGFAHLNTFFAWLFGFIFAGYLLKAFCPNPATLAPALRLQHAEWLAGQGPMPVVYAHAHYLWYAFAGVGVLSFLLMLVYIAWTARGAPATAGTAPTGETT